MSTDKPRCGRQIKKRTGPHAGEWMPCMMERGHQSRQCADADRLAQIGISSNEYYQRGRKRVSQVEYTRDRIAYWQSRLAALESTTDTECYSTP